MRIFIGVLLLFLVIQDSIAEDTKIKTIMESTFGVPVRDFSTYEFGRNKYEGAISIIIPEQDHKDSLFKIRNALPRGFLAFIGTTRNLSDEEIDGVELVAIETNDQFDILRAAQSNGLNFDITNEMVIAKLRSWDEKYGVNIWHAETDTIQLTLENLPSDLKSFANEVYKFCPDIIDQGSGNVSDISDYLQAEKAIYLWWD